MKNKTTNSHIPKRLTLLFFIIVLLFALLVIRLVDLQVVNAKKFTAILNATKAIEVEKNVPRGQIFDRNGTILVGNKAHKAVQYTRGATVTQAELVTLSKNLANVIAVPIDAVSEKELKEYWLATHEKELNERLSKDEQKLTGTALYTASIEKVSAEDIQYNDQEKEVIALFSKMNATSALSSVTLKAQDLSEQEIAFIAEHAAQLPGVSIGSEWERTYPEDTLLRSLIGNVTTEKAGIPYDTAQSYLARGYKNNDRVGISYIEQQYDDVLRGTKEKVSLISDATSEVIDSNVIYEGKPGDNLILSVDVPLQKSVDAILSQFLQNQTIEERGLNYSIYAIVQQVKTGEILAISGKTYDYNSESDSYMTDKIVDDPTGVVNKSFGMGSVVKAATIGIGYMNNIITDNNNTLVDEPLTFEDTAPISSVFNRNGSVAIDDVAALQFSSNIYMARIALSLGGQANFQQGDRLRISDDTVDVFRKYYGEFGLGVKTGIDLPSESAGYAPKSTSLFDGITISFGQFDLYTPLQISQYMTTVANNGIRLAPRLVKEIRQPNDLTAIGNMITEMAPKLLNRVPLSDTYFNRIKEGLYRVTHGYGGTEYNNFSNYRVPVAAKTGTAEAFYDGPLKSKKQAEVINSVFSGYAPSNDPDISVTVIIPYMGDISSKAGETAKQIFDAYYARNGQ